MADNQLPTNVTGLMMNASSPANATFLNKAVAHLNKETQRGEYAPTFGSEGQDNLSE